MTSREETMVRVYKDPKDYQRDVKKLAKDGWQVSNTVDHQPRAGFARTMSGLGLLGSRPKAEMVVTYARTVGGRQGFVSGSPVNFVECPQCRAAVPVSAAFCPTCGLKRNNPPR